MRIVFMGTPDFAVESLKQIKEAGCNIVGVVTATDKPVGRGKKIQYSAVKKYALENNISPILQPEKLKDETFITELKALNADLFVVVAFRMLPELVWGMPQKGTINLHASLLPCYRGAAPINWAVINGETETGVTTFFIEKEIDTGKILHQQKVEITEFDNAGTLHDRLMLVGADLLVKTVDEIAKNIVNPIPQSEITGQYDLKPAPKIFKDDCKINWQQGANEINNFIRGLSPYPAAFTMLVKADREFVLKIYETDFELVQHAHAIGELYSNNDNLKVAVTDGYIVIKVLQIAGKKRMKVEDFLRGFSIEGCRLQ